MLIKKLFFSIVNLPLYYLSYLVPKSNNIMIFGGWLGKQYSDNPKYLYEYIKCFDKSKKLIWFTKDKKLHKKLSLENIDSCEAYSIKGYWYTLLAKYAIVGHSIWDDLNPYILNKKTIKIQLWHGVPIKKIGLDDYKRANTLLQKTINILFPFNYEYYDMVISTSTFVSKNLSSAFGVNLEKVKVTGYPRNDKMVQNKKNGRKKIIYAPTYRGEYGEKIDFFENYGFNLSKINSLAEKLSFKLHIKLHPANLPTDDIISLITKSQYVDILCSHIDLNTILSEYDLLITDYSGAYIDYLLLDKPVLFFAFDLDYYIKTRGLYYDYFEITSKDLIATNWDDLMILIESNLNLKENSEIKKIKKLFHKYEDDQSSSRVYREILNIGEIL